MAASGPRLKSRPLSCTLPSAPGSVSASAGANQAAVTWTAANGNGNAIDAYVAREATGPDAGASIATSGSATTATLTGLSGGTAATFSVVAESSCGTGPAATSPAATPTGSASAYLGSVLASAPSALYRLAEPSGTVMADSSGHDADGSYSGQETLGQGAALASDPAPSAGYSTCCDGIAAASPALPLGDDARTVEAWINTTSATADQAVAGYGQISTDGAFIVSVSAQAIGVDGYNDYLQFPAPRPLDDGHWHLITVTYDGTTVDAYLDGQLVGSASFSGTLDTLNPAGLSVADFSGYYNAFDGDLADLAVYPSALTAATAAAHFSASGYSRPTAAKDVNVFSNGPNAVAVTWAHATASGEPVTGYLVSALGAAHGTPSVATTGDGTAARLTGLPAGTYTFRVIAMDSSGNGPAAKTKAFTVTGSASTYASTVLSAGPSVFYRLADFPLGPMADSSGHGATGAYDPADATLAQPGPLASDAATAVADNGDDVAGSGDPSLPVDAAPRTLEGWVNTTSGGWLAGYGTFDTAEGFAVEIQADDVVVSGASDDLTFTTKTSITDGDWHFVAVTSNGTTATVYVDGASLGAQTFPSALDTVPAPPGFVVGGAYQDCCGAFTGDLADVAVFPAALSAAQITAQFTASGLSRPPAPTSPAAAAGANQATVSWEAPSGADPAVTGYLITAVKGSTPANAVSVPASATSATVTGLAGGSSYTFRIQAVNEYGAGTAATTTAVTPSGSASTYASRVLSAGPSVFYRLADTGWAMADSSGHGATGVYDPADVTLGQPGPLASDPATAVADNGDDLAGQGDRSLPAGAAPRTLEGWVNTTSGGWLAGYGTFDTAEGFAVEIQPDDVVVSGASDDLTFTTKTSITDGDWHFVAVTSNGTTATVYVDGASLGAQTFPSALDTVPAPPGFVVGGAYQDCCGAFTGDLADVAVFPAALSAAQITAQFTAAGTDKHATRGAIRHGGGIPDTSRGVIAAASASVSALTMYSDAGSRSSRPGIPPPSRGPLSAA
jgi:Concanavalin A-like lectin/glucanases superfamily/Fibronectin type III domain